MTAKNESGCISDTLAFSINSQPVPPEATIGYGAEEFQATGTVHVSHTGQQGGNYSAVPAGLVIDPNTGTIDLSGSTSGQSYIVTYSFGTGSCATTATANIKILASPTTIKYPLQDYCAVDSVKIIHTGFKNGRYTAMPAGLSINDLTGTVDLSASAAGTYIVIYTYQDGSLTQSALTTITVNALPIATITSDPASEIYWGQTVTLTASGGASYEWIGENIISGQHSASIKARPEQSGIYKVIVCTACGCCTVEEILITVKRGQGLIPNNVITPNGDRKNDTWIIRNIQQYPNNSIKIYDTAGRLVYSQKNYDNDWDGTVDGNRLNEGVYIYVIDKGDGSAIIKGTVTIIRDQP